MILVSCSYRGIYIHTGDVEIGSSDADSKPAGLLLTLFQLLYVHVIEWVCIMCVYKMKFHI